MADIQKTERVVKIEEQLGQLLVGKRLTLATAESCTGGNVAHKITSIAGSSVYYMGGVVSYSNEMKAEMLGVLETDIEKYGAVSEPVVRQMAQGIKRRVGTDCAIATSGIAGPGGGTIEKPVGTVWVAICTPRGVESKCLHLGTDRGENIEEATTQAIEMLYYQLLEED
ncbi:MAG: CinA family protein [Bacteroidales bacterium]|nr:CinA family protein [Bacteroidales bacterium]